MSVGETAYIELDDGTRLHPGASRYYPPKREETEDGTWEAGAVVYGTHRWPSRSVLMAPGTYREHEA